MNNKPLKTEGDELSLRWREFLSEKDTELDHVRHVLMLISGSLQAFGGKCAGRTAMHSLCQTVGVSIEKEPEIEDDDWKWPDLSDDDIRAFEIYRYLRALKAYGRYGLPISRFFLDKVNQSGANQEQLVNDLYDYFDEEFMIEWGERKEFRENIECATARFKIDYGPDDELISMEELEILSGVSKRTFKNFLVPSSKERLFVDEYGFVLVKDAKIWIGARRSYKESIGSSEFDEKGPHRRDGHPVQRQVLFVPQSRDGHRFSKNDLKEGTIRVSAEMDFESYEAALEHLQYSVNPAWERRTRRGDWTTVTANSWVRITADELGEE